MTQTTTAPTPPPDRTEAGGVDATERSEPPSAATVASYPRPAQGEARTVLSLHGIRTRGLWQKADLSELLGEADFRHIPLDYGYFLALALLVPSLREKKIRWFWDQYARYASDLAEPPHVIAHSFGTYIACEALRMHGEVRFGKVILCGSIVHPQFPWRELYSQERVENVLNDYGSADFWARAVGLVVPDAGPSGRTGFVDVEGIPVIQRRHPGWRHSDFFNRLHFNSWIRFLRAGNPGGTGVESRPRSSWPRVFVRAGAVLLIASAALAVWTHLVRPIQLRDDLVGALYGSVSSSGQWRSRYFEKEVGSPDAQPTEGDAVFAVQSFSAFPKVPRRWARGDLGIPTQVESGERFLVHRVYRPPFAGIWMAATVAPRLAGLEKYRYKYRYSIGNECSAFLMADEIGNWAEFTIGDDNCHGTFARYREVGADAQSVILHDPDEGGYYLRLPFAGGKSWWAPSPPAGEDEKLVWQDYWKLRLLAPVREMPRWSCEGPSQEAGSATHVEFANLTAHPVQMLWVDAHGIEHPQGPSPLMPGGRFRTTTFSGHAWCARSQETNRPVLTVVIDGASQSILIR